MSFLSLILPFVFEIVTVQKNVTTKSNIILIMFDVTSVSSEWKFEMNEVWEKSQMELECVLNKKHAN